ncbi:MAG: DUF2264 domain-containing protein [Luteitalea sp.]|nr:DUF2264 domain-containing protein [Luteitalea sp.]
MDRRAFLGWAGGLAGVAGFPREIDDTPAFRVDGRRDVPRYSSSATSASGAADRQRWIELLTRLADPVLTNLAEGRLKERMPVEAAPETVDERRLFTHLEAVGRLLAGLAPWIELGDDGSEEGRLRGKYAELARRAIAVGTDPASPDALDFTNGGQALVDAAFLAHATLRAPRALNDGLDTATRERLVAALGAARVHLPGFNNWLLFSATLEAALCRMGADWDRMRVDYALRQHEQWYVGDGLYSDGPNFKWDYYNSYVIQPMLIDILASCGKESSQWLPFREPVLRRARRYAGVLERLIAADGSFPAIGRSIAYRCGAFQLLAQMALRRELPWPMPPAQARTALTAVIRRTLEAPGTFDDDGWLTIGLCGHQPEIGETYMSTGSLYLCATAFLPLGLPPSDEFWTAPPQPWTSQLAWSGQPVRGDHALQPT